MKDGEFWGNVLIKFQAQLDNSAQFARKQAIDEDEINAYIAGLALLEKIRKMVSNRLHFKSSNLNSR